MGRVSKRTIDKNVRVEIDEQLMFFIKTLKDGKYTGVFMKDFLTEEEKVMLGKRLILFMLLEKGSTNTQIHNALGMSYETIRWYRTLLDTKSSEFRKMIKKMVAREKTKELWSKIDKALKPFELLMESRNNMKSRAKLINRDY